MAEEIKITDGLAAYMLSTSGIRIPDYETMKAKQKLENLMAECEERAESFMLAIKYGQSTDGIYNNRDKK